MLAPNQQNRLEALVTALTGVPRQSHPAHADELIEFLTHNRETEAIAFSVAKAAIHQKAFGETPGVRKFLGWASGQLSEADFKKACNFFA